MFQFFFFSSVTTCILYYTTVQSVLFVTCCISNLKIIYIIFVMVALVLIIVLPVPCLAFTAVGFVVPHRISTGLKIQASERAPPFREGCLV